MLRKSRQSINQFSLKNKGKINFKKADDYLVYLTILLDNIFTLESTEICNNINEELTKITKFPL